MTAQSSCDCSCPSSLLTREETPGSFPDYIPYEMEDSRQFGVGAGANHYCGKLVTMGQGDNAMCGSKYWHDIYKCDACKLKDAEWPAHPVKQDESASSTYSPLRMQELGDFLTRLDQRMQRIESLMSQLLEAMAEEDEQDEPRTYMDGSPV